MTTREKIRITLRGYQTIRGMVPGYLPCIIAQAVSGAALPFINIFMSARVITALAGGEGLRRVLTLVFVTVGLNLAVNLITSAMNRLCDYYDAKFYKVVDEPLNEKIRRMDYEHVENADVHLKLEQIKTIRQTNSLGLPCLIWTLQYTVGSFFKVVFSVALVAGAFTTRGADNAGAWRVMFTPWFSLIIIALIAGGVALEIIRVAASVQKQSAIFSSFVQANRMSNYYNAFVENYQAGKDLKLYALHTTVAQEFDDVLKMADKMMAKYRRVLAQYGSLGAVINETLTAVLYGFVALKALFGGFGAGGIVQYVGALSQLSDGVSGLMGNITMMLVNADTLALFYDFIDMPDVKHHGTLTTEKRADGEYEIAFRNVSFKYPGSDKYALQHFNLTLHMGRRMAVVGLNGSGKTTMIKLLCRLYDPTEGEITLNGIDIRKYDIQEYRDLFSVVFQDFKLFSFPLGQNVAASINYEAPKAARCLEMAGFGDRLSRMTKELDTPLYKDFEEDGVEISGGEAQKIALARALYKDAPFIILDEPTAALDPISEFEVYAKFNDIVGKPNPVYAADSNNRDAKTAVFISHRLSSCRFCDDIAVFHEGRLVQRGRHDTLLADENGQYHTLWHAQAQHYAEKENNE